MNIHKANNFIIDLTPSIYTQNRNYFRENDKFLELFLWYDAFIKPNDYKNIQLYCNKVVDDFQNSKEYFAVIDKYFSDNNIFFKDSIHIIRDFKVIRVIFYNKNDFNIHIKNGTKEASAFESLPSQNNIQNSYYTSKTKFDENVNKINNINNIEEKILPNKFLGIKRTLKKVGLETANKENKMPKIKKQFLAQSIMKK